MNRKFFHVSIIIFSMIIFIAIAFNFNDNVNIFKGTHGVFYLDRENFLNNEIFKLSGDVEFFNKKILSPDDFVNKFIMPDDYVQIPGKFENENDGSSFGYGTIRFKIKTDGKERLYSLKTDYILTSYNIFINGKKYASVGNVTDDERHSKGIYKPSIIEFYGNEEIDVLIQFSNFKDKISFFKPIYFGLSETLKKRDTLLMMKDMIAFTGLILLSIFYFNYYLTIQNEKKMVYFSFMCIFFAIRVLFVNERIFLRIFDDLSWNLFSDFVYISLFLSFACMIKYFSYEINRKNSMKIINFIAVFLVINTIALVLGFSDFEYFFLTIFEIIVIVSFIWIIFEFIVKFIKKEKESILLIFAIIILFLGSLSDILKDIGLIEVSYISAFSIFMFFFIQSVIISRKFSGKLLVYENLSKKNEDLIFEMKEINDNLENEVEKRTLELEEKTFQLEKSNLELKNLNNHLETISYIDELTKIPNRRMLFDEIKILIELALKNHQRVALLMIDIDYFKLYNDFYGHSKGDWCIFNIAQSIDSAAVEYGYFCARYGGEEFVVVGIEKHENEMASLAETIMDYVAELEIENENAPKGRYVTVSIGGCSYKVNGKIGIRTFIDFADDMLYDAKKSGRDIFKFKKI